jgi:hypothetical protein
VSSYPSWFTGVEMNANLLDNPSLLEEWPQDPVRNRRLPKSRLRESSFEHPMKLRVCLTLLVLSTVGNWTGETVWLRNKVAD